MDTGDPIPPKPKPSVYHLFWLIANEDKGTRDERLKRVKFFNELKGLVPDKELTEEQETVLFGQLKTVVDANLPFGLIFIAICINTLPSVK